MIKILAPLVLIFLVIPTGCTKGRSNNVDTALITWDAVTTLVDGSPLPQDSVSYSVWEMQGQLLVCETTATFCEWPIRPAECYTFGATATDTRTGLTSVLSDLVTWCAPAGGPSPPNKPKNVNGKPK